MSSPLPKICPLFHHQSWVEPITESRFYIIVYRRFVQFAASFFPTFTKESLVISTACYLLRAKAVWVKQKPSVWPSTDIWPIIVPTVTENSKFSTDGNKIFYFNLQSTKRLLSSFLKVSTNIFYLINYSLLMYLMNSPLLSVNVIQWTLCFKGYFLLPLQDSVFKKYKS